MKKPVFFSLMIIFSALLILNSCEDDDPINTPIPQHKFELVEIEGLYGPLNKVYFFDEHIGLMVGDSGTVLKTSDGGDNWKILKVTDKNLLNISYYNYKNIWIVGEEGTIMFSSNTGNTWVHQSSPVTQDLYSVFFVDADIGWAVGKGYEDQPVIINTHNGGHSSFGWNVQSPPEDAYGLHDVYFTDELNGYACGYGGTVVQTDDGGIVWEKGNQVTSETLNSVYFISPGTGFCVGNRGVLVNTADAGEQWWLANNISAFDIFDLCFYNSENGWCCGQNSDAYYTSDGAVFWDREGISEPVTLHGISMVNESFGWAVGVVRLDTEPVVFRYVKEDE
jgi:photosystem II stability/assembly factor-like uncharacterized protein